MNYICAGGNIIPADQPVLKADNKSYRYGDGLFETIKVSGKKILLEEYHFKRFFEGLKLLQFEIPALFTRENLSQQILLLCEKNKCDKLARVRLSASRGNGGIYENDTALHYIIECWPLDEAINRLNENGLVIGIYPDSKKGCDKFSNLKSANYLPYVMAARHAKENKWNDCLVLNMHERVAESTIANLFLVKGKRLITPLLSEGCVDGVMRKYLIENCTKGGYSIHENPLTRKDVKNADEVFLTNAISGIRWVKQFGNKIFQNSTTQEIYAGFIKPLWA